MNVCYRCLAHLAPNQLFMNLKPSRRSGSFPRNNRARRDVATRRSAAVRVCDERRRDARGGGHGDRQRMKCSAVQCSLGSNHVKKDKENAGTPLLRIKNTRAQSTRDYASREKELEREAVPSLALRHECVSMRRMRRRGSFRESPRTARTWEATSRRLGAHVVYFGWSDELRVV